MLLAALGVCRYVRLLSLTGVPPCSPWLLLAVASLIAGHRLWARGRRLGPQAPEGAAAAAQASLLSHDMWDRPIQERALVSCVGR